MMMKPSLMKTSLSTLAICAFVGTFANMTNAADCETSMKMKGLDASSTLALPAAMPAIDSAMKKQGLAEYTVPKAPTADDQMFAFVIDGENSGAPKVKWQKSGTLKAMKIEDGAFKNAHQDTTGPQFAQGDTFLGDVTTIGGAGKEHHGGVGVLTITSLSADALKPPAARLAT